jgi:hypothetical protein
MIPHSESTVGYVDHHTADVLYSLDEHGCPGEELNPNPCRCACKGAASTTARSTTPPRSGKRPRPSRTRATELSPSAASTPAGGELEPGAGAPEAPATPYLAGAPSHHTTATVPLAGASWRSDGGGFVSSGFAPSRGFARRELAEHDHALCLLCAEVLRRVS